MSKQTGSNSSAIAKLAQTGGGSSRSSGSGGSGGSGGSAISKLAQRKPNTNLEESLKIVSQQMGRALTAPGSKSSLYEQTAYQRAMQMALDDAEQEKNFANSGLSREEYYQQMQAAATRAGKKSTGMSLLYNPNAAQKGDADYDPFASKGSDFISKLWGRYVLNKQNLKEEGAENATFKDYLTGKFVAPTKEQRTAAEQRTEEELAMFNQDRAGYLEKLMTDTATANAALAYAEKHRYDDVLNDMKADQVSMWQGLWAAEEDAKKAQADYDNYIQGEKESADQAFRHLETGHVTLAPNLVEGLRNANDRLIEGRSNITGRIQDRREYYPQEGWTEEQKKLHGYLYATDRERADQYAMAINQRLNYEAGKAKAEEITEDGVTKGEWAKAQGARFASGVDYFLNAAEYNLEGGVNASGTPHITNNDQVASFNQIANAVDTAISNNLNGYDPVTQTYTKVLDENIPVIGGKGRGDVYQLGMSILQSMMASATGPVGTYTIFFGSAAQSSYEQALERGASQGQALTLGMLNGIAEGLFEAASIDKVKGLSKMASDRSTVLAWLRAIGVSGVIEGSEELNTGIADLIIDAAVMNGNSQTQEAIRNYMAQGMSYDEAWKAAFMGNLNDLAFQALGGAISGAVHGNIFTGVNLASNAMTTYQGDARALMQEAQERGVKGAREIGAHEDVKLTNYQANKLQAGIVKSAGGVQNYVQEKTAQAEADFKTVRTMLETLEMDDVQASALMSGFRTANITAEDYAEGVRQAFTAGRIGLSLEQARGQFADTKLTKRQFENAFRIGAANQTPDIQGAKAKIDGKTYSIRMKGSDTVVFTSANGKTIEMTRTEALTREGVSIPEEVVKLIHATEQFGENAGEIYNLYTGNMGIDSYAAAMNSAIHWAENGVLRQRIENGLKLGQRTNLTRLTEEQIALAEKIGETARTERKESVKARAESIEKKPVVGKKGRVFMHGAVTARGETLKGVELKNLNAKQKDAVRAIRTMANLVSVDYVIYDGVRAGTNQEGTEAEKSWGFYEDGRIYININAGTGENYIAVATLAHELTHFMQDFAGNEYEQLKDEIIRIYYENDPREFERVVKLRQQTGGEDGKTLSYDAAVNEVIANSCMEMLNDTDAINQLCANNPTLGQKILDFLSKLIKDIFGDIDNIPFRENAFYKAHYDEFSGARDRFAAALKAAAENAQRGEATETISAEELNNLTEETEIETAEATGRQQSRFVEDAETLKFLEDQEKAGKVIHTYKSFVEIDGKLYPPMAAKKSGGKSGKLVKPMEVGRWEESVGNPNITLKPGEKWAHLDIYKDDGKATHVAYNPYQHSSNLMLNDQFSSAYDRPNLVTYECIVPESELTSGYHAKYAKDTVGWNPWHSGVVASKIRKAKGIDRQVFLSRWLKPVRKVPEAEVAQHYKELLEGTDVAVPSNVVPPALLYALEDAGVNIKYTKKAPKTERQYQKFDEDTKRHINESMTMDEARNMVDKAYRVTRPNEWLDEGEQKYKNAEDWLQRVGADEVAMYIDNDFNLIQKYTNSNEYIVKGDFSIVDVIEAYQNGTLTGKQKQKAERLNTAQRTGYKDSRFYAPQDIQATREMWETANLKANAKNKNDVYEARKNILIAAHNGDIAGALGITQAELNKKLRTWSNYSSKARDISNRINSGVAEENRWTGIQNSSILSDVVMTDEDIRSMVGTIEGNSSEFQRSYIGRTMLALDTHIDWSWLNFEFRKQADSSRSSVRGTYNDSARKVVVGGSGHQNTTAHEMGHALDYQWARDLFDIGESGVWHPLSENTIREDLIRSEEHLQFYHNFKIFIDSLTDVNDNNSSYTQEPTEVFARFIARFVEWTRETAGQHVYKESSFYNDRFTQAQYVEFAKLLQEKSMLDGKRAVSDTEQQNKVDAQNAQEEVTITEDGKTYPLRQYSLKSMEHDIQDGKMFDDLAKYTSMQEEEIEDLRVGLTHLTEVIALHREILDMNETYGKENRPFKAFKPNSDPLYTLSLDFSTLCRKRLMTQYVIEKLQTELTDSETGKRGRALSAEEQLAVRDLMKEYGKQEKALKVACAMCYVEAARLKAPKQINKFLRDPKSAMLRYFALKNKEFNDSVKRAQADFKVKKGYAANTAKKNMKPADVTALNKLSSKLRDEYGSKAHPASEEELEAIRIARSLPRTTFLTAANLAQLAEDHPVIYDAYTATIRTATRSKSLEADIPYYYGDSYGEVSDEFIRNVNAENGMRFSSWSDFQIQHMLDMMTAVIELSTRKCSMHGYTKFLEQVRIFGKTGMMFNMSGVPQGTGLKADGSLDFSPTESVLVKSEDGSEYDAITARNEFPETAGLQCIGISNEHIFALLASDIIDYVIPYHTSGLNASLRRMAQISNWSDFTSFQNAAEDKSITFDKNIHNKETWHKEPVFSEFFNAAKDPANGYKEGEAGIETMRRAANLYKEMCAERGLRPKFSWGNSKVDADFSNDPNYWKLLIDRKMINQNTGALIEQKPVTPTFDFDEIEKRVQEAVDAYDSTLQDRALGYVREHLSELPQRIKDLKKSGAVKKAKADAKKADELSKRFNELQAGVVAAATEGSVKQAEADEKKARVFQKFDASVNQFNDGFYSKAEQVVTENMPGKMAGDQVIKFLTGKGVKAEEIRWSGLQQFLEGKKSVSKDEVLSFLQQNRVQVETKILDNSERDRLLRGGYQHDPISNEDYPTREDFELAMKEQYGDEVTFTETEDFTATGDEPARELAYTNGPYYAALVDGRVVGYTERLEVDPYELEDDMFENGARWGQYKIRGGENYREILFKFPGSTYHNEASRAHWNTNAPGTFAHARIQDMKTIDGKRVLFVEEIQSDWHNAGAKTFFGDDNPERAEYRRLWKLVDMSLLNGDDNMTPEENARYTELREKYVPLEKDYYDARREFDKIHRVVKDIVEDLFTERVDQHVFDNKDQYSKDKRLASALLNLSGGDLRRWARAKNEDKANALGVADDLKETVNNVLNSLLTVEEHETIEKYLEIRDKLIDITERFNAQANAAKAEPAPDVPFAGSSDSYLPFVMKNLLRMAAEGSYDAIGWTTAQQQADRWSDEYMKGYRIEYDQDLPKFMNKYAKQWGGRTGTLTLDIGFASDSFITHTDVWGVDLTDAMKQSVTQTGQPLYQKYDGQLSFDDMGDDYSRSQWNAEYRQRIETAEELTERVKNYLTQRGVDPEELEEYGARESYFNRRGDIDGAADMIRRLSDLSQDMNGTQRQEAYELMEELLPHAESEALGLYTTNEGPINPDFSKWYNDRNPSLYYPGYTPGDLMLNMHWSAPANDWIRTRDNTEKEIDYLKKLLKRDNLSAEFREDAEDFLQRLDAQQRGKNDEVFYQKYVPDMEETAEERDSRKTAEIRAREEKQLLHETVVSLNRELKKLNWKLSGENEVREDDCLKLARQYKKTYGSTVNTQELAAKIKALGDYIVSAEELDDARIRADAEAIAYLLIDSAREVEDMWSMRNQDLERHQDAASRIQGKKFYYPENLRGDLAREGGYNSFRRANMGRFTLSSKDGDSIDAFYTELHDTYPDLFPELTNEGDQIIRMAEIFEEAKPDMVNPYAYEDDNFLAEVANGIFEDVLGEGIRQKAPSLMARVNLTEAIESEEPALSGAEFAQVQKDLAAIGKELEAVAAKADALEKRWATVSANEELAQKKLANAEDRIQRLSDVLRRESLSEKLTEQQKKDAQAALKKAMTEKAKLEKLLQKAKENTAQVRQERNEIRKGRREAEQKRDSLQRQLNRATARNAALQVKLSDNAQRTRDRLAALRAEKNARIEQIRAEGAAKVEEVRAREKAEKWSRVASERERYQQMAERARERRIEAQTRGTLRKRITKIYNEFVRDITHPTEGHHVPPEMMRQAVDVLQALNMDTSREGTKSGERLREKLAKLKVTYDAIQNDKDFRNAAVYDETVSEMLQAMIEEVGDTPINRMTGRQMESVYNVLVAMRTTARTALKIKMQGEERDAYEVARKMTNEVRSGQKPSRGVAGAYLNTQLTPERMFNRLGGYHKDNTWSQVYRMLNEGQLESTRIFVEGSRIFEKLLNSKDYDGYVSPKNTVDIGLKDEDGNAVPVTHDMLVSLWMHLQNEDNTRHAILGGLTIPNQKQYYAGNRARGSEEAVRVLGSTLPELKRALELREQAQQTEDAELKRELWKEIGDLREKAMSHATTLRSKVSENMTAYDRQWAAALTELFDVYSKEQLNKTTMEVYGIKRASVEHYWPINVDGDFLNTPFESVAKDFSIENAGFMKERVNSSKPIRLVGSSDVASSQLKKVSQYSGLMPVIRSFNKIWGKTQIGYQDSLKNAVHTIYGDTGVKYIENLMADLNGARSGQESPFGQALNKLRGNMAQAALTLSMRTAFGQTASYPTAAAVVGWKPLMQALAKGGKNGRVFSSADRELIEQYSPLLRYRNMGYSTTELGDISTSNSRMARLWKKMRWMTGWIQAMDSATVGRLWYAAEYYVDDHNKALKKGTDAYYEEVAKVFNDIVEKTQPDYTTMQRPDILRNPNALVRSLTMFMTQRLQNANIMYDAAATLSQMKKDYAAGTYGVTKEDVQQAAVNTKRAATSLIVAGVTITAFKFLADVVMHSMNAYRDDDKDLTGESVGLQLLDMFLDSMVGNLLFGSDVYKLVESKVFGKTYYGIEVSGISTVSDVAEDMSKLFDKIRDNGFKVGEYKGELNKMAKDVAQLLGIPLSNAEKIVGGIINHGIDIANGEFGSFEAGVERKTSQNGHRLYRAYEEGDTEKVKKIRAEAGDDQGTLNQSLAGYIKDLYREGDITEEEATQQLIKYAEVGKYSAADAIGKINFEKDFGFKFDDIQERYLEGSMSAAEARSALVKYGGKTADSAKETVDYWKEKYEFDKRYGTEYERYDLSFAGAKQYYKNFRNETTLENFADQWKKFGATAVKNYYGHGWKNTGLTVEQYSKYGLDAPIYGDEKAQAAFTVWNARLKTGGMSIDRFMAFLNAADADGNDSLKQDELGKALLAAISSHEMSYEDAEALWGSQGWKSTFKTWSKKKRK